MMMIPLAGIPNALLTTVGGPCVAIPALVAYNYLTRKVEGLVLGAELSAVMNTAKAVGMQRAAMASAPKKTPQ
jgi:biopolymer transport protein ExbB/TolQ